MLSRRIFIFIFVTILTFGLFATDTAQVQARVLPRFNSGGGKPTNYSTVVISPVLRADRKALVVYFAGLNNATAVTYTLSYNANGKSEGVRGTIQSASEGNSTSRTLLFGTCSSGVCRYHSGISNMKLEVSSKLKSGKTTLRRYSIRV